MKFFAAIIASAAAIRIGGAPVKKTANWLMDTCDTNDSNTLNYDEFVACADKIKAKGVSDKQLREFLGFLGQRAYIKEANFTSELEDAGFNST